MDRSTQSSASSRQRLSMATYVPVFLGTDAAECENFVQAIRSFAFDNDRHSDDTWKAALASTRMGGPALRWHVTLDTEIRRSWDQLEIALLEEWVSSEDEDEDEDEGDAEGEGEDEDEGEGEGEDGENGDAGDSDNDEGERKSQATKVVSPSPTIRHPSASSTRAVRNVITGRCVGFISVISDLFPQPQYLGTSKDRGLHVMRASKKNALNVELSYMSAGFYIRIHSPVIGRLSLQWSQDFPNESLSQQPTNFAKIVTTHGNGTAIKSSTQLLKGPFQARVWFARPSDGTIYAKWKTSGLDDHEKYPRLHLFADAATNSLTYTHDPTAYQAAYPEKRPARLVFVRG